MKVSDLNKDIQNIDGLIDEKRNSSIQILSKIRDSIENEMKLSDEEFDSTHSTIFTITLLISAFTGVILSVSLILLRRYLGYTKIERVNGSWFKYKFVNYAPTFKLPSWLSKVENLLPTVNKAYA